jgi:hypothetical protein
LIVRLAPSERTVRAEYRYAITVPIDLLYGTVSPIVEREA